MLHEGWIFQYKISPHTSYGYCFEAVAPITEPGVPEDEEIVLQLSDGVVVAGRIATVLTALTMTSLGITRQRAVDFVEVVQQAFVEGGWKQGPPGEHTGEELVGTGYVVACAVSNPEDNYTWRTKEIENVALQLASAAPRIVFYAEDPVKVAGEPVGYVTSLISLVPEAFEMIRCLTEDEMEKLQP
jgi:hypothetical protein